MLLKPYEVIPDIKIINYFSTFFVNNNVHNKVTINIPVPSKGSWKQFPSCPSPPLFIPPPLGRKCRLLLRPAAPSIRVVYLEGTRKKCDICTEFISNKKYVSKRGQEKETTPNSRIVIYGVEIIYGPNHSSFLVTPFEIFIFVTYFDIHISFPLLRDTKYFTLSLSFITSG